MAWLFLIVVVICITVVACFFLHDSGVLDAWAVGKRLDRIEYVLRECEQMLIDLGEAGGK